MVSMNEMMEMALGFESKKLPIKHIPVRCWRHSSRPATAAARRSFCRA
jgi:hypothetical protein